MKTILYILQLICAITIVLTVQYYFWFNYFTRSSRLQYTYMKTGNIFSMVLLFVILVLLIGSAYYLFYHKAREQTIIQLKLHYTIVMLPCFIVSLYWAINSIFHPGSFIQLGFWNFGIFFTYPLLYLIAVWLGSLNNWFFYITSILFILYHIVVNIIVLDMMDILRIK